jgi:hypothetical protein
MTVYKSSRIRFAKLHQQTGAFEKAMSRAGGSGQARSPPLWPMAAVHRRYDLSSMNVIIVAGAPSPMIATWLCSGSPTRFGENTCMRPSSPTTGEVLTENEVVDFARRHLADFKTPRSVSFHADFPPCKRLRQSVSTSQSQFFKFMLLMPKAMWSPDANSSAGTSLLSSRICRGVSWGFNGFGWMPLAEKLLYDRVTL